MSTLTARFIIFFGMAGRYGSAKDRNHGYGRSVEYAGRQVLQERYGGGHFGTVAVHSERWALFGAYLREHGIRDLRRVDAAVVRGYAAQLRSQDLSVATIQNRISTINVVLTHAREGQWQALSPRELAGAARSRVRTEAPASLDRVTAARATASLRDAGYARAAAAYALAREFGLRSEEASKADLVRWAREARSRGMINILDGTKGGRDAPRWVRVTGRGAEALRAALAARPEGSQNLLAPGESYAQWRHGELRAGREVLHTHGIRGYHDARAAYACERYEQITGHAAPVVAGQRMADRDTDRAARAEIAVELGHGRIDVLVAYVGSAR